MQSVDNIPSNVFFFQRLIAIIFIPLRHNYLKIKNLIYMQYNEIGKTGMKVSNLGFGASSLGGVFHGIREDEAIQAVHTAVDGGINFIDVSPYYGHLKAETVLGKALKDIKRDRYVLSTKVGRYGKDGVNYWDYSAKRAKESVYESMERLLSLIHI